MSLFTDLWFKVFPPAPKPAPVPAPTLVDPVPVPEPPPPGATAIKIEHYNKSLRRWKEQPCPFFNMSQLDIKPATSGTFSKVRVTVQQGKLTITSSTAKGKHNPKITKFTRNQTFAAGTVFVVECTMGPATDYRKGHWDDVTFGVYSKELGQIIGLSARVAYP